jgi:hypothetical protein
MRYTKFGNNWGTKVSVDMVAQVVDYQGESAWGNAVSAVKLAGLEYRINVDGGWS